MAGQLAHSSSLAPLPRTTVLAAVAFLDAFQKVADMATNTRGRDFECGEGVATCGHGLWLKSVVVICGCSHRLRGVVGDR